MSNGDSSSPICRARALTRAQPPTPRRPSGPLHIALLPRRRHRRSPRSPSSPRAISRQPLGCRAVTAMDTVKNGALGAVAGAVVGAPGGAIAGGGSGAGKGAAIGGLVGAGGGTLYGLNENRKHDEQYREAYGGCMRSHGYVGYASGGERHATRDSHRVTRR